MRAQHEYFYKVVILGSGPAGMSAAVATASEGLSTIVVEGCTAIGGQAKYSSRIENYMGFPGGLTGPALMSRSESQALKFGAEFVLGQPAIKMEHEGKLYAVTLADGTLLVSKVVMVATGLLWRTLKAKNIERYLGRGVYYGASMDDAVTNSAKNVLIVGGANSAGQAALHFASFAKQVHLVVRAESLDKGMSSYLIERLAQRENIKVHLKTSVMAFGDGSQDTLNGVMLKMRGQKSLSGVIDIDAAYIFIGAEPQTTWLGDICSRDERGYLVTDYSHMTGCAGLFAAGDVRAGSTKRIASAVGEGAHAVAGIHKYLGGL